MPRLADALARATTREIQGPSGIWYRVRAITSYDTLATRAPALLATLTPKPPPDRRGQPIPKAPAPDAAAHAVLSTVYAFASAGVVAWRAQDGEWEPVRLVEGDSPGEGEEAVSVVPWGDLSAIAEAVGVASGLTEPRRGLQPAGAGDPGHGGGALPRGPLDGGAVEPGASGAGAGRDGGGCSAGG
jgi:hypothetical protein